MRQLITLVNQLASRHKDACAQFLLRLLPSILATSSAILHHPIDSADQTARAEITEVSSLLALFLCLVPTNVLPSRAHHCCCWLCTGACCSRGASMSPGSYASRSRGPPHSIMPILHQYIASVIDFRRVKAVM